MNVTLKYLEMDSELVLQAIAAESDPNQSADVERLKYQCIKRLYDDVDGDRTPLENWMVKLHTENGLEPRLPARKPIADAIMQDGAARRFMTFLA